MWSVSDPVGPDSATNSPLAFTVSNLPLTQKWHLSFGFQSMGSGGGGDGDADGLSSDDFKFNFSSLTVMSVEFVLLTLLSGGLLLTVTSFWNCDAKFFLN